LIPICLMSQPLFLFFLLISRAPSSTLFPYTTLFRSEAPPRGQHPRVRAHQLECIHVASQDDRLQLLGLGLQRQRAQQVVGLEALDRKSTRLNSSHDQISYAVFCLKKKKGKARLNIRS